MNLLPHCPLLSTPAAERLCKEQWDNREVHSKSEGGIGRPGVVIACSALKKWYRDILRGEVEAIPPAVDDLVSARVHIEGRADIYLT